MEEISNIPESVRNNIRKMLEEATQGINFPESLKYMQTQICFEMYKSGWRDGFRAMEKSIELMKDTFEK